MPLDRHGVGRRPERRRHGVLVPRLHREQRGERAQQAGQPLPRGQQRAGAVLRRRRPSSSASRRAASLPRSCSALALGAAASASRSSATARAAAAASCSASRLLAHVDARDARLEAVELGLGGGRPLLGLGDLRRQPLDLLLGRLRRGCARAATWPASRARPSRRSAAARSRPASRRSSSALGLLGLVPRVDGVREALARPPRGLGERGLLLAARRAACAAAPRGRGRRPAPAPRRSRQQAPPVGGQRGGAAHPLAQAARAGTRSPARGRAAGAASAAASSSSPQPPPGGRQLLPPPRRAGPAARSRRRPPARAWCERDEVVGQQPRLGVAQVRLHDLGAPGDLGLAAQRLELAADLGDEVGEPGEVGLHRVELAERLLLALAVLEDARGLLDEPAALLGRGVQHGVELALPHDHVHLAADARVGEQLLDVEQPARAAVDRVLASRRSGTSSGVIVTSA